MTYNRKSSQKISRICLYIAIAAMGYVIADKLNRVQPEVGVLNTLETVQSIHQGVKGLFVIRVD